MRNLPSNRIPPQLLNFFRQESREATALKRTRSLTMDVRPNGSQPSAKGPVECFTGNVRMDPLFEAPHPARARVTSVTLDPGGQQGSGGPDLRHCQAEAMRPRKSQSKLSAELSSSNFPCLQGVHRHDSAAVRDPSTHRARPAVDPRNFAQPDRDRARSRLHQPKPFRAGLPAGKPALCRAITGGRSPVSSRQGQHQALHKGLIFQTFLPAT